MAYNPVSPHNGVLATSTPVATERLYRRIGWRLLPLLFAGYVFAYLDRVNISFAAHQMKIDLGFTDAVYGFGAGIFFLAYFLCEVPSNLLLQRIGARLTLARIMILWGFTSCCMVWVDTPSRFYVVRVLLGVFEAGFAPGVMLYLTFWYPGNRLAKVTALFLSGATVAGVVGAPISGVILDAMQDVAGLRGWQWLFILEGLPTVFLGLLVLKLIPDRPKDAHWLSADEKRRLSLELPVVPKETNHGLRDAIADSNVWTIAAAWFTLVCGLYAIAFWMPLMLRQAGLSAASEIGVWSMVPYASGAVGMVLLAIHSDRTRERRWHVVGCAAVGALSLALLAKVQHDLVSTVALLALASASLTAAMPILLSVPMATLPSHAAPGGIALINCIGLTGGFFSPFLLGWVKTSTGELNNGLYAIAALIVLGAGLVARVVRIPPGRHANPIS